MRTVVARDCSEIRRSRKGTYRLLFNAGDYYRELHLDTFYSEISVVFVISNPDADYHVPLLINPFGYSTYRGS